MVDFWFINKFTDNARIANNMGRLLFGVNEPFDLKYKIAFFIHELYEGITNNPRDARRVENIWRKLIRMKLRSFKKHWF